MSSQVPFHEAFEALKQKPVYVILGVQGSGTNLLRRILSSALNISVVQDQALVVKAALRLGRAPNSDATRREFARMLPRLLPGSLTRKTQRRIKTNASFQGIKEQFERVAIRSGADLAMFVYAYSAYMRGTSLMAIKSDDLWEDIAHVDEALPNRRIILLTRDFRDNLLSICKKNFGPVDPLIAASYVKRRFAAYETEYRRTAPSDRLHVRFEDLLAAPESFVAAFAEQFSLVQQGYRPMPVDTRRIRRDNTRKWTKLSPKELARCESVLCGELERYGYPIDGAPREQPSRATWLLAAGRDTAKRVPQKLMRIAQRLRN